MRPLFTASTLNLEEVYIARNIMQDLGTQMLVGKRQCEDATEFMTQGLLKKGGLNIGLDRRQKK